MGEHNSWTDTHHQQQQQRDRAVSPHYHHLQQSSYPPDPDGYRENVPGPPEFQPPGGREPKLPHNPTAGGKQTGAKDKKTLRDVQSPLCASRLKPIRQKTKNAVVKAHTALADISEKP